MLHAMKCAAHHKRHIYVHEPTLPLFPTYPTVLPCRFCCRLLEDVTERCAQRQAQEERQLRSSSSMGSSAATSSKRRQEEAIVKAFKPLLQAPLHAKDLTGDPEKRPRYRNLLALMDLAFECSEERTEMSNHCWYVLNANV